MFHMTKQVWFHANIVAASAGTERELCLALCNILLVRTGLSVLTTLEIDTAQPFISSQWNVVIVNVATILVYTAASIVLAFLYVLILFGSRLTVETAFSFI